MMKSYKFKIKRPSKAVVQRFEQTLDICRELYNAGLQERRDAWELNKVSISLYDQQYQLPEIKKFRDDLKDVYSQVLQECLKRIDKAYKGYFERRKRKEKAGKPRFKGQSRYNSFTFPQARGFRLDGKNLILSRIGKVKLHLSRTMQGKIKTLTIKREVSGWFAIFTVETENELLPKTGKSIGIDAGIESFITLSDGTRIENFKFYQSMQKQLRVAQRSVSRKLKDSNSRKKAALKVKKIHRKIKNQRADFQHKTSTKLVKEYDLIAIEKLNITRMSKGIFAKQINDVAWGNFFSMLRYKAENADRKLIEVNPNGTSQTCICGEMVKKNLSVRLHKCDKCGLTEHRDIVSAKVILKLGLGHSLKDSTYLNRESVSLKSVSTTVSV